jgi:hypothetical protein
MTAVCLMGACRCPGAQTHRLHVAGGLETTISVCRLCHSWENWVLASTYGMTSSVAWLEQQQHQETSIHHAMHGCLGCSPTLFRCFGDVQHFDCV